MKKSTIKRTLTSLGLIGLTTLLAGKAQATPLVNEPFDEDANGTTLTSTGNWTAFSGAGNQLLTVTGGTINVSDVTAGTPATSGEDDRITFASSAQTGVLYFSALVTVPTTSTFSSTAGDYFFSGYNTAGTGGGYLGRVFVAKSADGGVAFGLSNAGTTVATLPAQQTAADLTLGQEYRLVLRIDPTAHTATLGVQLANATPYNSDTQLTITGGAAGTIAGLDSVAIRQGSIGNGSVTVDGLQVGTTLADVSGIATGGSPFFNAIPEPSTYAALGLGVLALLGVQRMRRRTA